jgi:pullulanase/glycogen debranching enzyme
LGRFCEWAEWNDRPRFRAFLRGDQHQSSEFACRIHGSADLFEPGGRSPTASVNFITCHDGFTLRDLVSYKRRRNEANAENNHDGHAHNYSSNHGVEGETDDPAVNALRRQQRLNLLATLLFSHGTPMLLAGDEFGNSQGGNNNAYAQDNETGWLDWHRLGEDPAFTEQVRMLIRLRGELPYCGRRASPRPHAHRPGLVRHRVVAPGRGGRCGGAIGTAASASRCSIPPTPSRRRTARWSRPLRCCSTPRRTPPNSR